MELLRRMNVSSAVLLTRGVLMSSVGFRHVRTRLIMLLGIVYDILILRIAAAIQRNGMKLHVV